MSEYFHGDLTRKFGYGAAALKATIIAIACVPRVITTVDQFHFTFDGNAPDRETVKCKKERKTFKAVGYDDIGGLCKHFIILRFAVKPPRGSLMCSPPAKH